MSKRKNELKHDKNQKISKRYKFYLGSKQRYILINCDFDFGNIELVKQISQFQYRLASIYDGTNTGNKVNSKSWFYFCVSGFPKNTKGRFFVTRVQTLAAVYNSKYSRSYKPVYKIGDEGKWERLKTDVQLVMREDQLQCVFQYLFKDQNEKVYFAFSYPFTFSQHRKYIDSLNQYILNDEFYFYKEVLVKSIQGRDIHLLTITSHDHKDPQKQTQQIFNDKLFPEKARPLKFTKPVIFVSARVHPSQTASSYAMKGLINFLVNKNDLRAKLLRKMFIFMIVPMINVDGVYHGHFRMDTEGRNLNRYYIKPSFQKHPAIYAIKQLANHLNSQNRLSFYFDLHAHNSKKGHFIYGNSINDFVEQVQSQVFCKLIAMNNKGFQYKYCNFSQKHMKAKDKNQDLTKQGCGRVVMHKLAKIIHSYSVQCGIISPNTINWLANPPNTDFKLQDVGFQQDNLQNNLNKIYKTNNEQNALFTCQMYQNLGKNLMVSILDVFDKNPYNRVYKSSYKSMDLLRRVTAFQIFHQDERFRMFERFVFGKVKNINDLIKEVLNQKLHYNKLYSFYFFEDKQLKDITWPPNIPGLCKVKPQSPKKLTRFRSKSLQSNDYSESFRKTLLGIQETKQFITQQQIQQDQQLNSQKSSETQNYDQDNNLAQINQIEEHQSRMDSLKIIDQFQEKRQPNLSQINKYPQCCQIKLIKQTEQTEVPHQKFQMFSQQPSTKFVIKNSRESYLRMIKPRFSPHKFGDQKYYSQNLQQKDWLETTRNQIKQSLNQQLRQQIKKRYKKQFVINKKLGLRIHMESKPKNYLKPKSDYPAVTKQRIKSETNQKNNKRQRFSQRLSKLELPLLTSQLMVTPIISAHSRQSR